MGRQDWQKKLVSPEKVLAKIKPGDSIFLSTGVAEPRKLVRALMTSDMANLQDLEVIQLVSLGDVVSISDKYTHKFRLKTFFSGWVASEAIKAGRVDLIPSRLSRVPQLIDSGKMNIDVAFVQITPPDESGFSSLGVAVDGARQAMGRAKLVVGEINPMVPCTLGDTFVHVDDFHFLVESDTPPLYFPRWPINDTFKRIGANVAGLIEDGSCLPFSIGPIFEALAIYLAQKRHLGIHSPFFTDPLMDLVKSGAVTNRKKSIFKGKSVVAYALGTKELMRWLNRNPLVEFQGIDVVADPKRIGSIDKFVVVLPGRKVDLTGGIALHTGKGNVGIQVGEAHEFFLGASLSKGGKTILALPSRNLLGKSNIVLSVDEYPNQFSARESLDMVVTEFGVASLQGKTIRERALALIDIAHPDDRAELVRLAKESHLLYMDQTYPAESAKTYPEHLVRTHTFKEGLVVRFRPIKPSDVEQMRRLFYRFSDEAVYYRYFSPIKTMPYSKMQEYVNVDYRNTMSIVGLVGEPGAGTIIAEARYIRIPDTNWADLAFVVDEAYQGKGIATYMLMFLIEIAKENGIRGFNADVLASNRAMLKVFERSPYPIKAKLDCGVYELSIPFYKDEE